MIWFTESTEVQSACDGSSHSRFLLRNLHMFAISMKGPPNTTWYANAQCIQLAQ